MGNKNRSKGRYKKSSVKLSKKNKSKRISRKSRRSFIKKNRTKRIKKNRTKRIKKKSTKLKGGSRRGNCFGSQKDPYAFPRGSSRTSTSDYRGFTSAQRPGYFGTGQSASTGGIDPSQRSQRGVSSSGSVVAERAGGAVESGIGWIPNKILPAWMGGMNKEQYRQTYYPQKRAGTDYIPGGMNMGSGVRGKR